MAQTCALIAPVQPVLHRVSCSNETLPNAPKHYETHQNMSLWSNGVDRSVHCEKFRCDFMARSCALIAPVQPVLHWVSCCNKILPNTPKHYETHTNMSLGSNGVDRARSFPKILMRLQGMNFSINCTCSTRLHRVLCTNETLPNAPKYYETHQNMSLGSNEVDQVRSLRKIPMQLRGKNFCINCSSPARFAPSFVQQRNYPKCTQTLRNTARHEFRVQWVGRVHSLRKIPKRHHGTNFCINCTSSTRFAPSFV